MHLLCPLLYDGLSGGSEPGLLLPPEIARVPVAHSFLSVWHDMLFGMLAMFQAWRIPPATLLPTNWGSRPMSVIRKTDL